MDVEALRMTLKTVISKVPSVMMDILDIHEPANPGPGFHPPAGTPVPWCKCGNCRPVENEDMQVCCGKTPEYCHSLMPVSITKERKWANLES